MNRLVPILAIAALATTALAQTNTIVVPSGYTNTVGNTNNAFPWNRGASSMRFQQVYDTSNFTLQGVNYPIIIQGLRFRPYPGAVTTWAGGSWPNIRVDMASCPVDYTAASTTFANNLGANAQTVLQGPVVVSAGSTQGAGVVVPWHVNVPFATPFLYDPSVGSDLTMDVYLDGTGWAGASRSCDTVSTAGLARGSRIYNTTSLAATTGTFGNEYSLICEISYIPASGLYASFTPSVTRGPTPLNVTFTSSSFTSDPAGITGYAWDFNGDNVVDSTAQNPTWTFNNCGTYSVSLTVTDATHPANTLTRSNLIVTDAITANFTTQLLGPATVAFTDTSDMPASSWAWDFNGDSVIDSTVQNPVWVFPNTNASNVSLTVTRLCSAPSTVTKSVVPLQQISHNALPNNGLSSGAMVFLDVNVINPYGVEIGSFDIFGSIANTAYTLDVWIKQGSYLTFEKVPSAWIKVSSATGTSGATTTTASNTLLPAPIYLPAGSYGMAMQYTGVGPRYQTGTGLATVANGDLSITVGASLSTAVGSPFVTTSAVTTPRWWSGTIYYGTHNLTGSAGYGLFGQGCPGSLGTSKLTFNQPVLGSTLSVGLNNLPQSLAIMLTGFSNASSAYGPLPFDMNLLGAPNCLARVSPDATTLLIGAGSTATFNLPLPNNPALSGVLLFNQGFVLDPGFNALGASLSDAAAMVLGF